MEMIDNTINSFFALLRAGLWEKEVGLAHCAEVDFSKILCISEEQAVVGLVAAGLEHMNDLHVPKEVALSYVNQTRQLERRNAAMNSFIGKMVEKMRDEGIYTLLVKGQGIAQCYERPLWRSSGDIDFFLSKDNYNRAKDLLLPLSSSPKPERLSSRECGFYIDSWSVELHGFMLTGLSTKVDNEVNSVQRDVFYRGQVRTWMNGMTAIFLPAPNNDVFFVFTQLIKHFYKDLMTLRPVCDWCRLLWTFRGSIDDDLLEKRLTRSELMDEWCGFAALAVDYLGMPVEAMPLYRQDAKWSHKAKMIVDVILKGPYGSKIKDIWGIAHIFPYKTFCYLPSILFNVNRQKIKERVFRKGR